MRKNPELTLNFLDEMGAYAVKLAETLSNVSLIQNIGDGQIFQCDSSDTTQSFAKKLCAATPVREKYPDAHFGVTIGFGELRDSALGLTGAELWEINRANTGVDEITHTRAGQGALGLQNDGN